MPGGVRPAGTSCMILLILSEILLFFDRIYRIDRIVFVCSGYPDDSLNTQSAYAEIYV